jgi:hypothetical protein
VHETHVLVSIDGGDKDMERMIAEEDWKPLVVKAIFPPASPLLFREMYPGKSERDCLRDTSLEEQKKSGCAGIPDQFGHFREAEYVTDKLHWVWLWHWLFSV